MRETKRVKISKVERAVAKTCALIFLTASLGAKAEKPNVLIVHTDEQSFRTVGAHRALISKDQAEVWGPGAVVETPFIDSIAKNGAVCANYYAACPSCTPSRATLLTGLYPHATGAPKNGKKLSEDVKTFAHIFRENGYSTSYVGKWHLGRHVKYEFDVKYNAGFDDNRYMMTGGHAPYFKTTEDGLVSVGKSQAAKVPKDELIHLTDYFTNKTLEILERDKDKPFCIMLSIPDPHTPDYATPPYHTMYDEMQFTAPKTMDPDFATKRPIWGGGNKEGDTNNVSEFNADALRQYFGMVKHIDDSMGRLLKFIEDNGLSDNTIVIFTSDHGEMFHEHNRMNKGIPYEGSAKVPFVIQYPSKIPAGKIIHTAYTNADFTPTLLSLAGIKTENPFHGEDTAPDFVSEEKEVKKERIVYYRKNDWIAATDGRHKLVLDRKEKPWLISLEEDPDELVNFFGKPGYEEVTEKLQNELMAQAMRTKEPLLDSSRSYKTK